ncbi:PREDICTED: uncharacterized protein LOC107070550 [Polistes dominula]|uniref:Uncharacterized protein LOC107070550 n=1 Tax=Polistes dominula TaxID=743375 RepID=A0ABM1IVV5_POLDO|nr:PREDICTED: uncharacterized protein LOC107070550 [Polistes dominula]
MRNIFTSLHDSFCTFQTTTCKNLYFSAHKILESVVFSPPHVRLCTFKPTTCKTQYFSDHHMQDCIFQAITCKTVFFRLSHARLYFSGYHMQDCIFQTFYRGILHTIGLDWKNIKLPSCLMVLSKVS